MKGKLTKHIVFLLALTMILTQISFFPAPADASKVDLTITGEGVYEDVIITENDWSKYQLKNDFYSTNNSLGFHKIVKTKGYDLFDLIGEKNLKTDEDYLVTFVCSDGFEIKRTISELKESYHYKDFTEKSKEAVSPMIAKYSRTLADYPKNNFNPPIRWEDRELIESDIDNAFPRLVFGQKNIDDMNMSQWGKEVVKIVVGDEKTKEIVGDIGADSTYKHISHDGAPYNVDAITSATLTIEGPGVEGYRAISLRQLEEDLEGQSVDTYYEKVDGEVVTNTYESINAKYLIDNYVDAKSNAGKLVFKDISRQTILESPIEEVAKYEIAYGINEVPLVYLDSDVGYREDKHNADGCFKLVYEQDKSSAKEFSNIAYIYIEENDAKNIYEHSYAPYDNPKYTDYELLIHGSEMDDAVSFTVSDIEGMDDLHYEAEYSLSNSEYFWYFNTYKGVKLWDLLLKAGMDPKIDEDTQVQFIAADNYNFAPMTIKDIKDPSKYAYYEKDLLDRGDGSFDGDEVEPLYADVPPLVAYGFNKYPYVIRPTDDGYNPGLGNDGGPIRLIFGKTSYNDPNGANQVQFLKEIIIGEGESIATDTKGTGQGEITKKPIDKDSSWNHNQGVYKEYLDEPVLRVTGPQVKEPMTFTLRQIESLTDYALRDVYSGDGVREFEGIRLWDLITEVVGLKDDVDVPTIRVFSGPNYNQILRSTEQVENGVLNSQGKVKEIILAYGVDGYPLVANEGGTGYAHNNAFGPIRLIIEENKSMWVKWVDCIVVGSGDYEEAKIEDVKELDLPDLEEPKEEDIFDNKTFLTFRNDTGKALPEASIRSMEIDKDGNLWVGSNNGGLGLRDSSGKWTTINEVDTENAGKVKVDTSYAIVQRENGDLWIALGGALTPQGILVKSGGSWNLLNTENSSLPNNFVQELELDGNGGIWIGTGGGLAYVDKDDSWSAYTKEDGLVLDSIDAIEPDGKGGVWFGYYPGVEGEGEDEDAKYIGAYQYMEKDGNITTYDGFDNENFNINWVRSISIDSNGGVWIVRSGNAPGFGPGEVDYIKDGNITTYKTDQLIPDYSENNDVRLLEVDKSTDLIYIATTGKGVVVLDKLGNMVTEIKGDKYFPNNKWNNVYFLDYEDGNLLMGTNGGAGILTDAKLFKDIKPHWAQKEIEAMATLDYINGSNNLYRPNDNITRAEFLAMVVRILGLEGSEKEDISFTDVSSSKWYYKDISKAVGKGLINGYGDNTFKPDNPIKRQEVCSILAKVLDKNLTEKEREEMLSEFNDEISEWAKEAVAVAVDSEIINGLPNNIFGGDQHTTRAQAAVMLYRYLNK